MVDTAKIEQEKAIRHAPVALPGGSYELRELGKALEKATDSTDEDKRQAAVNKVLLDKQQLRDEDGKPLTFTAGGEIPLPPDHIAVDVERDDRGFTERMAVPDPKLHKTLDVDDGPASRPDAPAATQVPPPAADAAADQKKG